jgi:L-ascorbate metabolism protein UlaG (beta-lactamase superfamily)
VVGQPEVTKWFEGKGVKNTHHMNIGGSKKFDFGTIKMVNAIHSSSMPDGSYGGTRQVTWFRPKEKPFTLPAIPL